MELLDFFMLKRNIFPINRKEISKDWLQEIDIIIKKHKLDAMKYFLFSVFCLVGIFHVSAQKISINKVVASNSVYVDEDGDTPDWIELHNDVSQTTSFEGWSLSDDQDNLKKWSFTNS